MSPNLLEFFRSPMELIRSPFKFFLNLPNNICIGIYRSRSRSQESHSRDIFRKLLVHKDLGP